MSATGKRLIQAANEALAIVKGEADPSTYRVHVPDEFDVRALRRRLDLTQVEFGRRFGFGVARVRDWEQGRTRPDAAARAFLVVIAREPEAVTRALLGTD